MWCVKETRFVHQFSTEHWWHWVQHIFCRDQSVVVYKELLSAVTVWVQRVVECRKLLRAMRDVECRGSLSLYYWDDKKKGIIGCGDFCRTTCDSEQRVPACLKMSASVDPLVLRLLRANRCPDLCETLSRLASVHSGMQETIGNGVHVLL